MFIWTWDNVFRGKIKRRFSSFFSSDIFSKYFWGFLEHKGARILDIFTDFHWFSLKYQDSMVPYAQKIPKNILKNYQTKKNSNAIDSDDDSSHRGNGTMSYWNINKLVFKSSRGSRTRVSPYLFYQLHIIVLLELDINWYCVLKSNSQVVIRGCFREFCHENILRMRW